ncbi:DUF4281 domain-containing protein [Solitalea longa]|uniref:DUF4281 domain-containing protein n=1 Tax=Solitalea longa TaxID=2079460 RepID=A0A2S4ZY07_9SPHI|nr:ABA4-like family protein [Solitalea longa]POY34812.1 DUF4281 domain-containing protein [Solitalea longa]
MSLTSIFSITGPLALVGWCMLITVPRWKQTSILVFNFIVVLFAMAYLGLIMANFGHFNPLTDFSSLDSISTLFENRSLLLAGWIHYLAFDLIIGLLITEHSLKNNGNSQLLVLCQLLTFLLGPIGFLLYYISAIIKQKTAAPQIIEVKE